VFNQLSDVSRRWTATDYALSEQISNYWVNFARTGDPNGPGLPHWPSIETNPDKLLEISGNTRVADTTGHELDRFFDHIYYGAMGTYREARCARPPC
jgi:para-nitrobenzyl esterase